MLARCDRWRASAGGACAPSAAALVHPEGPLAPPPVRSRSRTRCSAPGRTTRSSRPIVADAAVAREDRVQAKARPAAGVQHHDAVPRQLRRRHGVNPERPLRLDRRRQHVPRVGGRCTRSCLRGTFMRTPLQQGARPRKRWRRPGSRSRSAVSPSPSRGTTTGWSPRSGSTPRRSRPRSRRARFLDIASSSNVSARSRGATSSRPRSSIDSSSRASAKRRWPMDNARLALAVLLSPDARRELHGRRRSAGGAGAAAVRRRPRRWRSGDNPDLRAAGETLRAAEQDVRGREERLPAQPGRSTRSTASRRTSSRCTAASPRSRSSACCRILATSSPSIFTVPLWDWGGLRSKLHQSETRAAPGAGDAEPDAAAADEQPLFDVQRSAGRQNGGRQPAAASPIWPPRACA